MLLQHGWTVEEGYSGAERRQVDRPGRRITDLRHEQESLEMRQEIVRLKAVVEILADAVQALTAAQQKPTIPGNSSSVAECPSLLLRTTTQVDFVKTLDES